MIRIRCAHCREGRCGVPPGDESTSDDFDCMCPCHSVDEVAGDQIVNEGRN